jgi:hypothetical protein
MRLPRVALAGTLLASLALTLAVASTALAGGRPLATTLTPGAEPLGGDPSAAATGSFSSTLNPGVGELCYDLSWANLSANVIAAHVHVAPAGVNGPVVIPLSTTMTMSGSTSGCVAVERELAIAILQDPSGYYVNVHTTLNPGGAVRGQL